MFSPALEGCFVVENGISWSFEMLHHDKIQACKISRQIAAIAMPRGNGKTQDKGWQGSNDQLDFG